MRTRLPCLALPPCALTCAGTSSQARRSCAGLLPLVLVCAGFRPISGHRSCQRGTAHGPSTTSPCKHSSRPSPRTRPSSTACGPKGKHNPDRVATRHGTERGSVTLGGRRVPVARSRVRAANGSGAVAVYELLNGTELLGKMAMERLLGGTDEATPAQVWRNGRSVGPTMWAACPASAGRTSPGMAEVPAVPDQDVGPDDRLAVDEAVETGARGGRDPTVVELAPPVPKRPQVADAAGPRGRHGFRRKMRLLRDRVRERQ